MTQPQAMIREAAELRRAGRFAEAEAAYARLLALFPDLSECWYNLGWLQRRLGRYEAALASYQQALDRGVSAPEEVRLNRGVIFADHLRQDAAAEAELVAALKLNSNYVPALLNLGNLYEDRGDRAGSRAMYERVLTVEPAAWEALARLANLASVTRADDPLIVRVEQALARPDVSTSDKAALGFGLGRALDAAGAYDRAFDAYSRANALSRAANRGPGPVYDRAAQERYVDRLIEAFPAAHPAGRATTGKAPVFICGMFRSGSTLTEQVLAGHPRVTSGGELAFIPDCVRNELTPFPEAMARATDADIADVAQRYAAMLGTVFPDADLVTDKRPDNFLYIGLIKRLFPDAKIVHTTRHPLDNCLSVYFLHLDHSMGYALDLADTAHHYRQYRRLMAHWSKIYADDILDFDYDGFVGEPRGATERLLDFLGLDWSDACLNFHHRDNAVKTASVWQVREPLYQRSSGRWRHYARQLEPVRAQLDDLLPPD